MGKGCLKIVDIFSITENRNMSTKIQYLLLYYMHVDVSTQIPFHMIHKQLI